MILRIDTAIILVNNALFIIFLTHKVEINANLDAKHISNSINGNTYNGPSKNQSYKTIYSLMNGSKVAKYQYHR